ncbi:hypothetical protein P0F65_13680 [Sphingomonas sp. I4]
MTHTTDSSPVPLTTVFHEYVAATMDEDGFAIPHALVLDASGGMTIAALNLEPGQAYAFMLKLWADGATEMIFALDRYALPGQHTTLGDLLAGFHFTRAAAPRPFIIEYQYEPRIVQPINWENPFWTSALDSEFSQILASRLGIDLGRTPN